MILNRVRNFSRQHVCYKTAHELIFSTPNKSWNKTYSSETATFETKKYRLHKLDKGPSTSVTVTKEDALKFYTQMQIVRRMETASANMYKDKIIRGFCHLYSGQEAICVGVRATIREQDAVISAYRSHGWTYIMGASLLSVLAELTGRYSGCSRGKGGSMHMYADGFYGGNGIVGAHVPLGAGITFALKYKGTDGVCFTAYGDGAANQGQVFEVFNISKLWNLPCIYICENNGYGMGTSSERAAASTAYYTRGDYIPGFLVDGMDVLAMREASQFALDYVTSGKGPIILEAATYRYHGHSMSDPGTSYRTRGEIKKVRETRDPITRFREKILDSKLVTSDEIKQIDNKVKKLIAENVKKSKEDKEVDLKELPADIYAKNLEPFIRNTTPFVPLQHITVGKAINL